MYKVYVYDKEGLYIEPLGIDENIDEIAKSIIALSAGKNVSKLTVTDSWDLLICTTIGHRLDRCDPSIERELQKALKSYQTQQKNVEMPHFTLFMVEEEVEDWGGLEEFQEHFTKHYGFKENFQFSLMEFVDNEYED